MEPGEQVEQVGERQHAPAFGLGDETLREAREAGQKRLVLLGRRQELRAYRAGRRDPHFEEAQAEHVLEHLGDARPLVGIERHARGGRPAGTLAQPCHPVDDVGVAAASVGSHVGTVGVVQVGRSVDADRHADAMLGEEVERLGREARAVRRDRDDQLLASRRGRRFPFQHGGLQRREVQQRLAAEQHERDAFAVPGSFDEVARGARSELRAHHAGLAAVGAAAGVAVGATQIAGLRGLEDQRGERNGAGSRAGRGCAATPTGRAAALRRARETSRSGCGTSSRTIGLRNRQRSSTSRVARSIANRLACSAPKSSASPSAPAAGEHAVIGERPGLAHRILAM
jgi:hypothetical protein